MTTLPAAVSAEARHQTATESIVYSFKGPPDGQAPFAGLLNIDGTLYGTTVIGGTWNHGTVFDISGGTETVLYSFAGGSDGDFPEGNLIYANGMLYGTTNVGGNAGCGESCGTVFQTTTTGSEKVLYAFAGSNDGENPVAGLTAYGNKFYGTTQFGGTGSSPDGTVFSVTKSGVVSLLHTFSGNDGDQVNAGLARIGTAFYGAAAHGGSGYGTLFKMSKSGIVTVLHNFAGGSDGAFPQQTLTDLDGTLYGVTQSAGTYGYGTVFKLTKNGQMTTLYSFTGGSDGKWPSSGLLYFKGKLYGETQSGGGSGCFSAAGCGTVYSITKAGHESVVYPFEGVPDAFYPQGGLIDVNGTLYGTSTSGGAGGGSYGYGAVFSLTP